MKVTVVCFDIDGTMYPKWVTHYKLAASVFRSPWLALRYQKFRRQVRLDEEVKTVPENKAGFRLRQAAWLSKQPSHSEATKKMEKRIERQFYASWRHAFAKLKPYPLVRETMEQLKAMGVKIAALSDFPIEQKLVALGVDDLVDFACCSEEAGYLKPHPAPFLSVCEALGVSPENVLYVGDSCQKDIIGAKRVGMQTCLIAPQARRANKRKELCPEAAFVCSDYKEFQEQIPKMLQ